MSNKIRAMYYNIFGYMWWPDKENNPHLHSGPIALRQQMQADLISHYAPDFIGMQEYCLDYRKGMTPLMEKIGYVEIEVGHDKRHEDGTRLNYSPIFYRPEKLKLLDKGFLMYPETMPDPNKNDGSVLIINDVSSKSLTYGVFEQITTHKKFIAVNTHFMYSARYLTIEQARQVRTQNAQNALKIIDKVRANGYEDLPVIFGGDLNTYPVSAPIRTLTEVGGMQWLWDIAPVKDNSKGWKLYQIYDETQGKYVKYDKPSDDVNTTIDFIFYGPTKQPGTKMIFDNYLTITDDNALRSSDHSPRYTDFTLE